MTDKATLQISGISEEGQIVIFSVSASVLAVVLAVMVGSCIFFWKRRARRRPIGLLKRAQQASNDLAGGPRACAPYYTFTSSYNAASGVPRPTSSSLHHMSPTAGNDRPAHESSQWTMLPGCSEPERRIVGASCRGGEQCASGWSRPRLRAESLPPSLPCHSGGEQDFVVSDHTNGRSTFVPYDIRVPLRTPYQTIAARNGPRDRRLMATQARHFSFPPPASVTHCGWRRWHRPPQSGEGLPQSAPDEHQATEPSYDRDHVLRTIQLLRAKNDRVRQDRLARLRGLSDPSVAVLSGCSSRAGVSSFYQRCFSAPSECGPHARRKGSTANYYSRALARLSPRQSIAISGPTKRPRPALSSSAAGAPLPSRCPSCTISSARGGTILHPRRGGVSSGCWRCDHRQIRLPHSATADVFPPSTVHRRVLAAAGASKSSGTVNCSSTAAADSLHSSSRLWRDPPASATKYLPPLHRRAASAQPLQLENAQVAEANTRRGRFAITRQPAIDYEDDACCDDDEGEGDSLSSEPPSPCVASLNSSLTPELPAARKRRMQSSSDAVGGGGSTSVDEKYEFDMRTPG